MRATSRARRAACAIAVASVLTVWSLGGLLTQGALVGPNERAVVAWGDNSYGERNIPSGLADVKAISVGPWRCALALKADSTVVAWGENDGGDTNVPIGLSGITAISAGPNFGIALKNDRTVVAWGQTQVPAGLSDIVAVSAGSGFSLALKSDGTVVTWGQAVVRARPSGVVAISAGGEGLALKDDGTVAVLVGRPTDVPAGLSGVVAISAGGFHNLALKRDGTVVAWGDDSRGQTNVPTGLSDVQAISAGNDFSLALKRDGTVVGWGDNEDGQIHIPDGLSGVVEISAGGFSLAVVGPGGNAGGAFPWSIALAVVIPLGIVAFIADAWRRRRSVVEQLLRLLPPVAWPTAIALLLALLSLPLTALTCDATDAIGNRAPASALGQWSAAAGAVLISALVAGTIGGPLVRRNSGGGAGLTFVIALLVAIPASALMPLALGESVGLGWFCLDSCSPVVSTGDPGNAIYSDLYFWFAPFVEPMPVLMLALGVGVWTVVVRRLPAR